MRRPTWGGLHEALAPLVGLELLEALPPAPLGHAQVKLPEPVNVMPPGCKNPLDPVQALLCYTL